MLLAAWLCWSVPLIGFFIAPLVRKLDGKLRDVIEVSFSFFAAICASMLLPVVIHGEVIHESYTWIPEFDAGIGVLVDPLSAIMANVVAWIGFLIMVYSIKYMEGDPGIPRFWALMNFFISGMLLLVLADNFLQMFVGWEMVGVASYTLIGYYYRDEKEYWVLNYPPTHCSMKAFVITKIGDLLMLSGALLIYAHSGTFSFLKWASDYTWARELSQMGLLLPTLLLLLGGPLGKSAQFPFHEWLPEAMAGPTPVSALIHAATMVKAGVYFVARILPIMHYAAWELGYHEVVIFFEAVALIGAFTAFLAGTQAMVARELKRILAYSTISQIGYMMLGLGCAGMIRDYALGLTAGILHLMSHATFKAPLFLTAGAVIHACETKDVYEMGGLRRQMPITFLCMLLGAMALAGVPPLSGFWSKDAVLATCAAAGAWLPLTLGILTAAVTMFYSLRMIGLIFFGEKSAHLRRLESHGHSVHEAHPLMWIPYAILIGMTCLIGLSAPFLEGILHHALAVNVLTVTRGQLYSAMQTVEHNVQSTWHLLIPAFSLIALVVGGIPSYYLYVSRKLSPVAIVDRNIIMRAFYVFLRKRWFINPFYYAVFVEGLIKAARATYAIVEIGIIERFNRVFANLVKEAANAAFSYIEQLTFEGFNFTMAIIFESLSRALRKIQTGLLSYNIAEIIIGLILLISLLVMITMRGI